MRKVVAWLFISLDGVVEAPHLWQEGLMDDDMLADILAQSDAEDAIFMGRVTYQEFAPFWPTSTDEPFASHINGTPKYIVSTTLEQVEWGQWDEPKLIKDTKQLEREIGRLKQQPGKDIGVSGSPTLVRSLLHEGLLDELKLMVHPVIVGPGKRLFVEAGDFRKLQLVNSKVTSKGVVILTYQPAKNEGKN